MTSADYCCVDFRPPGSVPFGAVPFATKWQNGSTLKVGFVDGPQHLWQLVAQYAAEWSNYANLKLDFSGGQGSVIRVSFAVPGQSYSAVGTDALRVPSNQPTMNFGWLDRPGLTPAEARAVILHEFGHALGMIHEHQNPLASTTIPWNKPQVYADLSGPPNNWDQAKVDLNMFQVYDGATTNYTDVDPNSIMMYPIRTTWVTDPAYAVGFNTQLSEIDKFLIGREYPS